MNEYECTLVCTESSQPALGILPGFHLKVPPQTYVTYVCICPPSFLRQHCSLCSHLTKHRQRHTLKAVAHHMWITLRLKLLEVCAHAHISVCKQQRRITDVLGDMMLFSHHHFSLVHFFCAVCSSLDSTNSLNCTDLL